MSRPSSSGSASEPRTPPTSSPTSTKPSKPYKNEFSARLRSTCVLFHFLLIKARGSPSESPPQRSGHGSSRLAERRAQRGQGADFSRGGKFASFGGAPPRLLA